MEMQSTPHKPKADESAQRFLDQIDADTEAIRWLEEQAVALNADRIEWHNHEYPGRTGSAWQGNTLLAVTVVLRDELNRSVLTCHEVTAGRHPTEHEKD
ncbi:TPA: hypothetical protein ACYLN4_006621 [Burkholderia lata]